MDEVREVKIGDRNYRIARFKGLKAAIAGAMISRVMREIPTLQERAAEFRARFRERNKVVITPAMAKFPRFAGLGLTSEDFVNGPVEFPEEPAPGAFVVNMIPDMFELAKDELQRFFGLLVIPNSELEEADDADSVDQALDVKGKLVMRQGDLDELVELVVVGIEVFTEQMASKRDSLGKLPIPWLQKALMQEEEEEPQELEEETQEPENLQSPGPGPTSPTPTEETLSPQESSVPPSSSDALDGDLVEETSSTEPLGVSSS